MADGAGRQSIELIEALSNRLSLHFVPTYIEARRDIPKTVVPFLKKKHPRWGKVIFCIEPIIHNAKKLPLSAHQDSLCIAYSMFESTQIPPDWVNLLNHRFDLVAVPDPFLVDIYEKSGVNIPIFVLPLGRNFRPFLDAPLKTSRNTPFLFGIFGAGISRKNHLTLIRAFAQAFGKRQDVSLLIHCRICDPILKKAIHTEIQNTNGASIHYTEGPLSQEAYLAFLQKIDCYVSPSKGEGFSIQPREAMALGIPTIVTDNSAQHTLCASGLVYSVPCSLQEPAIYEWSSNTAYGSFSLCTEEALATALLDMETHYDRYLSQAPLARSFAANTHYDSLVPLYLNLLKPKKVTLSSENKITLEGITTSSPNLYEKYRRYI